MDFEETLKNLEEGKKVTRVSWIGLNMFLWLKPATIIKSECCKDPILKSVINANGGQMEALATICMKTTNNKILTGWLPSKADVLANDWIIVK